MRSYKDITPEEYERALTYLRKELSPSLMAHIKYRLAADPEWLKGQQYTLGHDIRVILRKGGFEWGDEALYAEWQNLVDDVVNKGNI